ncbi:MAG: hypothetical protein ACPG4A_00190 [Pseudomonadales bacterium]
MLKKILVFILLFAPLTLAADHHALESRAVVEIYECMLNEGSSVQDVVALARTDFKAWVTENDIRVNTFIWEPVAVTPPYHEAEVRWINYFQTWADYGAASEAWTKPSNGKQAAKINAMTTCAKPVFTTSTPVAQMPTDTPKKPLIVGVCNLNDGATFAEAAKYLSSSRVDAVNAAIGAQTGMMLWTPGFGINPDFDFLQVVSGTHDDMMALFDGVRTGTVQKAQTAFNATPSPASCHWDLSTSYAITQ